MVSDRDLFLAYAVLMFGALLPIYHGAYASLRTPQSTIKALKKKREEREVRSDQDSEDEDEDEEEDDVTLPETLTSEDAYWLPVIGSAVLFSMFLVFKYLDKTWVDRVLGFYFAIVGSFAVSKVLISMARGLGAFQKLESARYLLTRSTKHIKKETLVSLRVTLLHPVLVFLACTMVGAYLYTRHWVTSNILALSLSLSSISMLSLDSFQTGSIMLMGLFLYDIFWVFGTSVMVSVARGFDGPIKIVWPKNFVMGLFEKDAKWQMTMLGLGDIVIPGIFIALALRFDQHRYIRANPSKLITKRDFQFAKPYFQATLIAYVVGLAVTMGVMHFTKAAQPALLYLSPACISAVGLCAARRGEVKEMWAWKDETAEEEKSETKKGKEESKVEKANGKTSSKVTRRKKAST